MDINQATQRLGERLVKMQGGAHRGVRILFVCALILLAALLVVMPFIRQNRELNARIQQRRTLLAATQQLSEQRVKIEAEYETIFSRPAGGDKDPSVAVLTALGELAGASGVKIVNIRQTRISKADQFRQVEVSLTVLGSAQAYARFLYALGDNTALFVIREFQLKADSREKVLEGRFLVAYNLVDKA